MQSLDEVFVVVIFVRQRRIINVHIVVCTYFVRITNIGGAAPQNMVLSQTVIVLMLAAGHMCNWFRHTLFVSIEQRPLASSAAAVVLARLLICCGVGQLWHRIPRVLDPSVAVIVALLVRLLVW